MSMNFEFPEIGQKNVRAEDREKEGEKPRREEGVNLYAGERSERLTREYDGWTVPVGILEYKVSVLLYSTCKATKLYKREVLI